MEKMDYNPFDALGLEAQHYDTSEINRAFRRASFHVHPDKRDSHHQRFPSLEQAACAKDSLLSWMEDGTFASAVTATAFKTWPRTFLNGVFLSPRLTNGFCQCNICEMVLRPSSLADHAKYHGNELCTYCGDQFELDRLNRHMLESHRVQRCGVCGDHVPEQDLQPHQDFHRCPVCHDLLAKNCLDQHARSKHLSKRCEKCPTGSSLTDHTDLIGHLAREYYWRSCDLCEQIIATSSLLQHLHKEHGLQACVACDIDDKNLFTHVLEDHNAGPCPACGEMIAQERQGPHFTDTHHFQRCCHCAAGAFDLDHLEKDHVWVDCQDPSCGEKVQQESLNVHLVLDHSWETCSDCQAVVDNLEEHMTAHNFVQCAYCLEKPLQERYIQHLMVEHRMKSCPFCDERPMTDTDLRRHLAESHRETEQCPEREEAQTEDGLPFHLQERHGWERCRFCTKAFQDSKSLLDQCRVEHDLVPCPECHLDLPEKSLAQHLLASHSYVAQPALRGFLPVADETVGLKRGGRRERRRKYFSGPCPECSKHVKSLDDHRRKMHGIHKNDTRIFREARVTCVDGNKSHSRSNVSRCPSCRRNKEKEAQRGVSGNGVD